MTAPVEAVGLPFQEAIDFFRQKVPVHTQHWTDVWRTAHSRGFMVAGAASDALLTDFREAIAKGLEQGTTLAEFRRDFDVIVAKHGWAYNGTPGWRSRIIYETNLSTAFSAGQYAQMTEPATLEAFPFWQYLHSGAAHPRLQHLAWNGLTLRADDGFWQTHYPPNGWRCGCRVRPISERGLGRMGKSGPDAAPPIETRPWRNPKTGEVHQVPVGIDPGFDYNPGLAWKRGGGAIPTTPKDFDKLPEVAPRTAAPPPPVPLPIEAPDIVPALPGKAAVAPEVLEAFLKDPQGAVQVGELPAALQRHLGARSRAVLLSRDTVLKQAKHTRVTAEDYLAAADLIAAPDLAVADRDKHVVLIRHGEELLWGVLKATHTGLATFLVSLRRVPAKRLQALLKRAGRIELGGGK